MNSTTRTLQKYDHRLRDLGRSTGNIGHAIRRSVPRYTAQGRLNQAHAEVVTVDVFDMDILNLQWEVLALLDRVAQLVALFRLLDVTRTALSRRHRQLLTPNTRLEGLHTITR